MISSISRLLCPAGTQEMLRYKLSCEVISASGCEVFIEGSTFVVTSDGIDVTQSKNLCVYSLLSLNPYIQALLAGIDPSAFGSGFTRPNDPDGFYLQCLDPGYPYSTGGHVLFRVTRQLRDSGNKTILRGGKEAIDQLAGLTEDERENYLEEQIENNKSALDFDFWLKCEVIHKGSNCGVYQVGSQMSISGANFVLNKTQAICPFALQSIIPFVWPLQRKQITPAQIGMYRQTDPEACYVECPNPSISPDDRTIFLIRRFPEE